MAKENLAAIDLGTNSCRLTIADKQGNFLYRDSIATKLGEGMYEHMCFTSQAFVRGVSAFETYAKIMQNYEVGRYRAIATASCRMAKNGTEFTHEVFRKTGILLEVVDEVEEARLNLKGASLNADRNADYIVIYDLGGGSTEITLAKVKPQLEIIHTVSIPWGGRNAAEAFDLITWNENNYQKLVAEIKRQVDHFVLKSGLDKVRHKACLLATSSTPLRLASMVKEWGMYERDKSDGVVVNISAADKVIEKIYRMSLEERIESRYIGENRAPIFLSACTIFKTIYDGLKFPGFIASLKGAQDGIIEELKTHG